MARILVAVTSGHYHAQTRSNSIMNGGVESLRVAAPQGHIWNLSPAVSATRGHHHPVRLRLAGFFSFLVFWRIRLLPSRSAGGKSHLNLFLLEDAL